MPRKRRDMPWCDLFKGVYHAFWYDPVARQTRRLSLRTDDAGKAQHRFAAFLTEGTPIYGAATGVPTVSEAVDLYLKRHVNAGHEDPDGRQRPNVVDKQRIDKALKPLLEFFGARAIKDITVEDYRAYAAARRAGEVGARKRSGETWRAGSGTIRRELNTLQAALNCAAKHKLIKRDEVPIAEKPTVHASRCMWLFEDELQDLRLVLPPGRVADFVSVAYYTAGRKTSIERLTVFQVDLANQVLDLSYDGDFLTQKRRPVVPIDPALMPTLTRMVAEAKAAGRSHLFDPPTDISEAFRWAVTKADMLHLPRRELRRAGRLTPHLLRHSRATHLLQAGADIYAVAQLLGDNPMTVARVYAHACSKATLARLNLKEASNAL
jgi:integrase